MKILLVGSEPLTAFELTSALEDAGHAVIGPAHSLSVALCLVQHEPVELAVVSVVRSVDDECNRLASTLKAKQGTTSLFIRDAAEQVDEEQGPDDDEQSSGHASGKPVQGLKDLLEKLETT